jgi:archaemetzincin
MWTNGTIQVVPVGTAARTLVKELSEALHAELKLEVVLGSPLGEPKYALNNARGQYHSTAILRRLASMRGELSAVVGVCDVDLFVPDSSFVFGESDRESRVALVSLYRLRPEHHGAPPNSTLLRARARTEMFHEAGHLSGLSHCDDPKCVMFSSSGIADTDRKGSALCLSCQSELRRARLP